MAGNLDGTGDSFYFTAFQGRQSAWGADGTPVQPVIGLLYFGLDFEIYNIIRYFYKVFVTLKEVSQLQVKAHVKLTSIMCEEHEMHGS